MRAVSENPGYERIEGVTVGQYVSYRFFRVDPAWRRLPVEERAAAKDAFADVVEDWASRIEGLRAYSVTGVRPEADFFLWQITDRWDDLVELGSALNGTPLAGLARDAALVRRHHQAVGLHRQEAGAPGTRAAPRGAIPRRLPVREAATLVLPHVRGARRARCGSTPRSAASS